MKRTETTLFESIKNYCDERIQEFDLIPAERKDRLRLLSDYLLEKYQLSLNPRVIIICTHNSRRSHLGQLWLATGADYFGLPHLETYSGGTAATAFNPRAVATVKRIGFEISVDSGTVENPNYGVKWSPDQAPYLSFSKIYDQAPNPTTRFAAVMVCTDADENCPVVLGMDLRLAIPFDDPKHFDDTELETQKYDERSEQIAREFLFVLSEVKTNLANE